MSVNGHISKELKVTCSVAQGSVLGLFLFLVHINALANSIKNIDILFFLKMTLISITNLAILLTYEKDEY